MPTSLQDQLQNQVRENIQNKVAGAGGGGGGGGGVYIPLSKYIPFYNADGYGLHNPQTKESYKLTHTEMKEFLRKYNAVLVHETEL